MSKILAPALGTLLALAPHVAQGATPSHKSLETLSAQTLSEVTLVVNNEMIATQCTPSWEATAKRNGFDVYRDATTRCYAWEDTYKVVATQSTVGVILKPEGDQINPVDLDSCITTRTYVDEFTKGGVRYLVVYPEDVESANVLCPVNTVETPQKTTHQIQPAYSELDSIPKTGSLAALDPSLVENGKFLKTVKLGLEETQLDEKLDNPSNLLHRSVKGVDVYAKYETVEYDPASGRLVLHLPKDKETDCAVTILYLDTFTQDGQRYFVIADDFTTVHKTCDEATLHAATETTSAGQATVTVPTESKPWHVKVFAGVGANEEELGSEYSLGGAGYGALGAQLRVPGSRFCLGANGDAIVSGTGSGFEGLVATVGYCDDRFDIAAQGGISWEPRAPETVLNGAPTLGILAHADLLQLGPVELNVGASGRADLYGGGVFPANVTLFLGASYDFELGGSAKDTGPEAKKYQLVYSTKPYSYDLPVPGPVDNTKKAEATRLYEEMKLKASNNKWDGVEAHYLLAVGLNVPLSYQTHLKGAQAAQALGDQKKCYERVLIAQSLATTDGERKETGDWINDLETNYASVLMVVDVRGDVSFAAVDSPFPPDHRSAIAMAQAELAEDGSFEGFIPIIPYTFGGETVEGLVPVSTDVTTEIHLEK